MRFRTLALLLVAVPTIAGCGDDEGSNARPVAVATTTHVGDLVRNVAGARVEVRQLLRPGSDPHDYEPRPSDAAAVREADLVLRSGGEVDGWLDGVLDNVGRDAPAVTLIDSVRRIPEDPHWWQDPRNALLAVRAIREALARADPEGRGGYERSARAYSARVRRLDRRIARCMSSVPAARRKLVTTHDALGYFARRYGIEVVGALIPSRSTQAQASARETQRLVDQIREEGVLAIFPESALNPKLERAVAREAGARVEEALWADALGPKGSSGATYLRSLATNAETMARGFGSRCRVRP